jgi:hypothetical protein
MMTALEKSQNSLDGEIIIVRRGVAIYKIKASPFYQARILNPSKKPKYIVRSTKEKSRIEARKVADEIAASIAGLGPQAPNIQKDKTFEHYATLAIRQAQTDVSRNARNPHYARDLIYSLQSKNYGLVNHFGKLDIRSIGVKDYADFARDLLEKRPELSSSVHQALRSAFRHVMKLAVYDGTIHQVPAPPKLNTGKSTARPFFRFSPLVAKKDDQYRKIREVAKSLAKEIHTVRGIRITEELHDLILFTTHTFVRPTVSELYALTHQDITIEKNPQRLLLTIRRGKTGYRVSTSTQEAVHIYQDILSRLKSTPLPTDYVFLPSYQNRVTARSIMMRQFSYLLKKAGMETDPFTQQRHSLYSLRHTAICFRMILSDGIVNLDVLARNAGTSVQMLQDFYMKYLPITRELARNLQSFGEVRRGSK